MISHVCVSSWFLEYPAERWRRNAAPGITMPLSTLLMSTAHHNWKDFESLPLSNCEGARCRPCEAIGCGEGPANGNATGGRLELSTRREVANDVEGATSGELWDSECATLLRAFVARACLNMFEDSWAFLSAHREEMLRPLLTELHRLDLSCFQALEGKNLGTMPTGLFFRGESLKEQSHSPLVIQWKFG